MHDSQTLKLPEAPQTVGEAIAPLTAYNSDHVFFEVVQESVYGNQIIQGEIVKAAENEAFINYKVNVKSLPHTSISDILEEIKLDLLLPPSVSYNNLSATQYTFEDPLRRRKSALEDLVKLVDNARKTYAFEGDPEVPLKNVLFRDILGFIPKNIVHDLIEELIVPRSMPIESTDEPDLHSDAYVSENPFEIWLRERVTLAKCLKDASLMLVLVKVLEDKNFRDVLHDLVDPTIVLQFAERNRRFKFLDIEREERNTIAKLRGLPKKRYLRTRSDVIYLFAKMENAIQVSHDQLLRYYVNRLYKNIYSPDLQARHNLIFDKELGASFKNNLCIALLARRYRPITLPLFLDIARSFLTHISPELIELKRPNSYTLLLSLPLPPHQQDSLITQILSYFFIPISMDLFLEYREPQKGRYLRIGHETDSQIGHFRLK